MPGVGFAERYVIARESNVVRVDFTRRRDPPAPRFPGAGALRPATRKIAAMDQGKRQARSASSPRFAGEGGWGVAGVLLCCQPPPCPSLASGAGDEVAPLGGSPSAVGLDLNPILTGSLSI